MPSAAATLSADPASPTIRMDRSTNVTISLDLGTEVASIFDNRTS
jgi:hypothetical protein